MKHIFSTCLILFSAFGITSGQSNTSGEQEQEVADTSISKEEVQGTVVEKMPSFPGGEEALMKYVKENAQYPRNAKKNDISGTVYVSFIIDKEGNVKDPKVLRGIGGGCDEEALRVIRLMPQWIPGTQDGRPVKAKLKLPIIFGLK